jgi:hypothetical protein
MSEPDPQRSNRVGARARSDANHATLRRASAGRIGSGFDSTDAQRHSHTWREPWDSLWLASGPTDGSPR